MGVPNSEVGYTSVTTGDGENTKSERICVGIGGRKKRKKKLKINLHIPGEKQFEGAL